MSAVYPLWIYRLKHCSICEEAYYSIYKVEENKFMLDVLGNDGQPTNLYSKVYLTIEELTEGIFEKEEEYELVYYNPEQSKQKYHNFLKEIAEMFEDAGEPIPPEPVLPEFINNLNSENSSSEDPSSEESEDPSSED